MKVSIITINFNNKEGLDKTIKSVISQSYSVIEYILIDGGSTDGSVDVIEEYADKISFWVSEKDKGVYHAMNKGIEKANGDYLLFLNSGDFFIDAEVLKKCVDQAEFKEELIYGNLVVSKNGVNTIKEYPGKLSFSYFLNETLPHPSTFIKKSLFEKVGLYNEKYSIVSDWEFWLKAIFLNQATYRHLPIAISIFNLEGTSSNPTYAGIIMQEKREVFRQYFPVLYEEISYLHELQKHVKSSRLIRILQKVNLLSNLHIKKT